MHVIRDLPANHVGSFGRTRPHHGGVQVVGGEESLAQQILVLLESNHTTWREHDKSSAQFLEEQLLEEQFLEEQFLEEQSKSPRESNGGGHTFLAAGQQCQAALWRGERGYDFH